jgi:hypothetical protein
MKLEHIVRIIIHQLATRGELLMTLKEQLIQEIQSMPDDLVIEILDFASFIKYKREQNVTIYDQEKDLPYRPASGNSILKHAGTWQGDDFAECLQMVYETRSKTKFDKHINPFE